VPFPRKRRQGAGLGFLGKKGTSLVFHSGHEKQEMFIKKRERRRVFFGKKLAIRRRMRKVPGSGKWSGKEKSICLFVKGGGVRSSYL